MKKKDEIRVRMKSYGGCRIKKLPLVEVKDALDSGGREVLNALDDQKNPLKPVCGQITNGRG